jgi:hypothetical protein
MPFRGVADAEQLKVLTDVLNRHCNENHIFSQEERMEVGHLIMSLYTNDIADADSLSKALAAAVRHKSRKVG